MKFNINFLHVKILDCYLKDFNMVIEYDGQHHFEEVNFNNKMTEKQMKDNFENVKRRDKIKDDYCKENGIKILRIPYWNFDNIELILEKNLK